MKVKGKKGMKQNHARSAEETKELIKKLAIEEELTPTEICDKLNLGYSTVMKYRKQIQREMEEILPKQENEEEMEIMSNENKNIVTFEISQDSFEVEVREKRGAKIYNLQDLKNGIARQYSIDIEAMTSKTIDNGEEFIYGTYLIPIANELLDYNFSASVKEVLFERSHDYRYKEITNVINSLISFINTSNQEEKESVIEEQDNLLLHLDQAIKLEEMANISSEIKKVRLQLRELNKEDKVRELLQNCFAENSINLEDLKATIKDLPL